MTPIILDSQEAVDRHNEKVKVQREAVNKYRESRDWPPLADEDLDDLFPFAQLRPPGFVGGSGRRYQWHDANHAWPSTERPVTVFVSASDRAAASATLTGGVRVWHDAICTVAGRHNCLFGVAVHDHEPEIIVEAQALLDREGK